jgi:hypothetical protein
MAISPTDIRILFTNYDIITYFLNLASCSEHFISIKHRISTTFNINKKKQSERLYAFNDVIVSIILKMMKVIPNIITVMLFIHSLLSIKYIYKLNNQSVIIYIYYKTCCSSRCSITLIIMLLTNVKLHTNHVMFIMRKFLSKLLWLKMATGNRIHRM